MEENKHSGTILIIDDEENLARLMKRVLERKGYSAVVALNGKEGIELFEQNSIEMVILDMNLPDMSGTQVLDIFLQKKADLKILLTSGIVETKEMEGYLKASNISFLQKPYENHIFVEKIEMMRNSKA